MKELLQGINRHQWQDVVDGRETEESKIFISEKCSSLYRNGRTNILSILMRDHKFALREERDFHFNSVEWLSAWSAGLGS